MTVKPLSLPASPMAAAPARRPAGLWPQALALGAAVTLGALAQQHLGWATAAATAAAAAALPLLRRARPATNDDAAPAGGSQPLQQQVLPVWQRNIEAARQHSEQSMGQLVERFASLSGQLDAALGAQSQALSLELGATDELMDRHRPELDALLGTSRELVARKNEMQATVSQLASTLEQMLILAQEVQSIGRATHLLALNASVEATRAGAAGGGFAVVAQEVRELASHSRSTGQQIARHTQVMREQVAAVHARAQRLDCDDDELERRADQAARGVVRALVGSLAEVGQSSRALRDAGRQAQNDIDDILMGLQSQDRLNQMLASVSEDVGRMSALLQGAPDDTGGQPQAWLARLEASYTMEEMRTAHHGTVAVDRQAGVEFF